jgi:hypothetical protein
MNISRPSLLSLSPSLSFSPSLPNSSFSLSIASNSKPGGTKRAFDEEKEDDGERETVCLTVWLNEEFEEREREEEEVERREERKEEVEE